MTEHEFRKSEQVAAILAHEGIEYSAEFVPQSKSRNAGEKRPCLNWKVTFKRGNCAFETDYMQGIGYLPGKKALYLVPRTLAQDEYERWAAERGRWHPRGTQAMLQAFPTSGSKPIPTPDPADVLYSLCLDAEALEASCFEDWADTFGYDKDSREAERVYRACLDTALKMRALFGQATINALRGATKGM